MLSSRWDRATMVRETVKAYTTRLPPPGSFNTILIITILSILISISITVTCASERPTGRPSFNCSSTLGLNGSGTFV